MSFRHLVPSPSNPHPRFDLSDVSADNAYTWADKALIVPAIQKMVGLWEKLYAEPFHGVTSDGNLIPSLYTLRAPEAGEWLFNILSVSSALLALLSPSQKSATLHPADSSEWRLWANPELYIPCLRHGIRLDECTSDVQNAVLDLVKATLSEEGYIKAIGCMRTNEFLGEIIDAKAVMNFWSYNFNMYGNPSATEPFGFQLHGHHLCLNIFILSPTSQIVISPTFMGAEPSLVHAGPHSGLALFNAEETLGLALMRSLPLALQSRAQVFKSNLGSDLPQGRWNAYDERHLAGAFQDNRIIPYEGVPVREFSSDQKGRVMQLVKAFVIYLPDHALEDKLEQVRNNLDETWFCWYGGFKEDDTFYFRVQSPVLIVEFDHHKV
jgi:hypothetical protein